MKKRRRLPKKLTGLCRNTLLTIRTQGRSVAEILGYGLIFVKISEVDTGNNPEKACFLSAILEQS